MNMKFIFLFLTLVIVSPSIAQDSASLSGPYFPIRPFGHGSLAFGQGKEYQEFYGRSIMGVGGGIRIGNVNKWKVLPYIDFNYYSTYGKTLQIFANNYKMHHKNLQWTLGVHLPIRLNASNRLRINTGVVKAIIDDSYFKAANEKFAAFRLGFGYERRMVGQLYYYLELFYDFQKSPDLLQYRIYDLAGIKFGLTF